MSFIAEDARDWTPVELCQATADMYYAIACRTDGLATHTHPMHAAMDAALNVAIVTAYPQEAAAWGAGAFINTVRDLFVDTRDPIDWCVNRAVLNLTGARSLRAAQAVTRYAYAASVEQGGYWQRHAATYYPMMNFRMLAELIEHIVRGEHPCNCGAPHLSDRRAAERFPDASRHGDAPGSPVVGVPAVGRAAPTAPATDPWHHALPVAPMPITCGAALTPYLGARPADLRCANATPCPDHPMETKALSGIALAVAKLPPVAPSQPARVTVGVDENDNAAAGEVSATSNRETYGAIMDQLKATGEVALREDLLAQLSNLDQELNDLGYTTCRAGLLTGAQCGDLTVRGTDRCPRHPHRVSAFLPHNVTTEPGE